MDYLKLLFTLYGWLFKFGFSQFQIKRCNTIIMYVVYVRIYAMVFWQFDYIYVPLKYTYIIYTICNSHFTETKSLNLLQPISLKVRTQQTARNHTVSIKTIVIKCGDKLSPLNIQLHGAVRCRKGLLCAPASREGNPHTAQPEDLYLTSPYRIKPFMFSWRIPPSFDTKPKWNTLNLTCANASQ